MFKRLFRPKWQHPDPAVRRRALEALQSTQVEVLEQVAQHDSEPSLRALAAERLERPEVLTGICREDRDADVRRRAAARLERVVAGVEGGLDLDERRHLLVEAQDDGLIAYVAVNGVEPGLRLEALNRVQDPTLVAERAQTDGAAEVRLALLDRVTDLERLEAIVRDSRNRDKRLWRAARERLDGLREVQQRPLRVRARLEEVCAAAEALVKWTNLEGAPMAMGRLEQQWQAALKELDEAPDPDLAARFEAAHASVAAAVDDYQREQARQAEEEAALSAIRQEKATLCRSVEELAADLERRKDLEPEDEAVVRSAMATARASWEQAGSLSAAEERRLAGRFAQAQEAAEGRLEALLAVRRQREAAHKLCREAEAAAEDKKAPAEDRVRRLEGRWKALEVADEGLRSRFRKAIKALNERIKAHRAKQEEALERLDPMAEELAAALDGGETHQAGRLYSTAQNLFHLLEGYPRPRKVQALQRRFGGLGARLREVQDWERWGNTQEREQLCEQVESLIGSDGDPAEIAVKVRAARDTWNKLGATDRQAVPALAERFNKACAKAFEPCERYYAEQAEQRQVNLEGRQAICQSLEDFAAGTDWEAAELKPVERTLNEARKAWREAGPVDRKDMKAVRKRFDAAVDVLKSHLDRIWGEHAARKQALVERAQALEEEGDLRKGTEAVKALQAEWKAVGPASRAQEQRLWKAFRAACDRVFERRREQAEARDAERRASQERREALLSELESITAALALPAEDEGRSDPGRAREDLRRLREAWSAGGPVPRGAERGLEKRQQDAIHALEEAIRVREVQDARGGLERAELRAAQCARIEVLAGRGEAARGEVDAAREALAAIAAGEPALDQRLAERFERAVQAALAEGEPQGLPAEREANLARARTLCIRMEVLAGVDSPAEDVQARMEYQVARLAEGMTDAERGPGREQERRLAEAMEVERGWWPLGALPPEAEAGLRERFLGARAAFYRTAGVARN